MAPLFTYFVLSISGNQVIKTHLKVMIFNLVTKLICKRDTE